ncbi:MAG: hypothetical protein WCA00_07865 [Candidatus Acidiferrales bacterium]
MRSVVYWTLVVALAILAALAAVAPSLYSQDPRSEILKRLNSEFTRTKVTTDRTDIVTAGAVLVLHKDGLLMCGVEAIAPPTSTYKNGTISMGFGANIAWGMELAPANQQPASLEQRKFVAGEKFWVTEYLVKPDGVYLVFVSDPYNDVRYYGQLKFPFAKNSTPNPDEVTKAIEEVVTVDAPADQPAADNSAPPAQQPEQPAPAPAAAAPAAAPETISLGQTTDQVIAILGQPQKIVNLGAKQMYFYPDMKVIFTNGKVSDVK